MQESVSMHKSPTLFRHSRMNQARSEEEEQERQKRKAKQNKNTSKELKKKAYLAGAGTPNFPINGTPTPNLYII